MNFLRGLAFWLWNRKDGQTSFEVSEIPADIFEEGGDLSDRIEVAQREFLTGAFLEKKGEETFFFGHRSFVEFLVADHMVRNIPVGLAYERYAVLIKDGVAQFLSDYGDKSIFESWLTNFSSARGRIPLEFIAFIQAQVGPEIDVASRLPDEFAISAVYRAFVPDSKCFFEGVGGVVDKNFKHRLDTLLRVCSTQIFNRVAEFRLGLDRSLTDAAHYRRATFFAGVILERLFRHSEVDQSARKTFVEPDYDGDRRLAAKCFYDMIDKADDRYILFDWDGIIDLDYPLDVARAPEPFISLRDVEAEFEVAVLNELRWSDVLEQVDQDVRDKVRAHFRFSDSIGDVVTRQRRRSRLRRRHP